jgi:hypothetical protein
MPADNSHSIRRCERDAALLRSLGVDVAAADLAARTPAERRDARTWAERMAFARANRFGPGDPGAAAARPVWLDRR